MRPSEGIYCTVGGDTELGFVYGWDNTERCGSRPFTQLDLVSQFYKREQMTRFVCERDRDLLTHSLLLTCPCVQKNEPGRDGKRAGTPKFPNRKSGGRAGEASHEAAPKPKQTPPPPCRLVGSLSDMCWRVLVEETCVQGTGLVLRGYWSYFVVSLSVSF